MLIDEPTASLDSRNRDVVVELIEQARSQGSAIVGIFHDESVRERVASRLLDSPISCLGPSRCRLTCQGASP